MHYTATRLGGRNIEITNEHKEPIGCVSYAARLSERSKISVRDDESFTIVPRGKDAGIMRNGSTYAILRLGNGQKLEMILENGKRLLVSKNKSFEPTYTIVDEFDNEVASIKSRYDWKALCYNYDIDVRRKAVDKDTRATLPFLLVYCTQHARIAQAPPALGKIAASFL
ncbi:MAG: hypothetical protein IAE95_04945 [Chitinophagaceae bacterium]|nr:hypothetical protein [Chitinophagaceae bacterium]